MTLVVSDATKKSLAAFKRSPSHGLLLAGPTGIGKASIAKDLAAKVLGINTSFEDYAYKLHIAPDDGKITIEQIRGLESFLSLKVPRTAEFNRVVLIEAAQAMSQQAQNALLKTLEEPPQKTFIILTVNHAPALLPTVRSRLQIINVTRPNQSDLKGHFTSVSDAEFNQAYFISGGLPGLMTATLEQADHPLKQATEQARELLKATPYQRLIIIDSLSKQRQLALDVCFILQQMASISLRTAQAQAAKRWQSVLAASFNAATALNGSAQPKLALTALALAL